MELPAPDIDTVPKAAVGDVWMVSKNQMGGGGVYVLWKPNTHLLCPCGGCMAGAQGRMTFLYGIRELYRFLAIIH